MVNAVVPQPLNNVWASNTPNKLIINDDDSNMGIIYQSLVVSNQMNGILNRLNNALRTHQCTGGYYTQGQRYFRGMIVKASITSDANYAPNIKYFECANDENGVGIVDVPLYTNVITSFETNGVPSYLVDPDSLNTTYWKLLDGDEQALKDWVLDMFEKYKKEMEDLMEETLRIVDEKIQKVTDRWKDLGNIQGSFTFDFAGENNDFNCFKLNLTGPTSFTTCLFVGAEERSGCFFIQSGGNNLQSLFSNCMHSIVLPWTPPPENSGDGDSIWLFYKVHPDYGVVFTRC